MVWMGKSNFVCVQVHGFKVVPLKNPCKYKQQQVKCECVGLVGLAGRAGLDGLANASADAHVNANVN